MLRIILTHVAQRRLLFSFITALVVFFSFGPENSKASEVCDFCNTSVLLNNERATCFLSIYDDRLAKLKNSNVGFVRVNLGKCAGRKKTGSKGVVDPKSPIPEADLASEVVYLDETSLTCIKRTIDKNETDFDPIKELQLDVLCR